MCILALLGAILTVFVATISAFLYTTYQLEKASHEPGMSERTPHPQVNISSTCDSEGHSDNDEEEKEEESCDNKGIFTYLKASPIRPSPLINSDPLFNSKRRVVVSKEVDLAIEKLIEELTEYYIFSWYQPLVQLSNSRRNTSPESESIASQSVDHLRQVLKRDIWHLLSSFIDRLYSANYVHFVATSLVNRLIKHVQSSLHSTNLTTAHSSESNLRRPINSHSSPKSTRAFSTQSSNASLSSNSSSSSLSSSLSASNLLTTSDTHLESTLHPNYPTPPSNQPLVFHLVSHLKNTSSEHALLHKLTYFLLDILLKESLEEKSMLKQSKLFKLLLSDFLSSTFRSAINRLSDPTFVNYQIVKLIQKRINLKDLIYTEPTSETPSGAHSLSSNFSVYDLKICLAEHNFNRLMEILDNCDDIDSLKTIRNQIIEEILDAAVIDYLNKQSDHAPAGRSGGVFPGNSRSLSPFSRKRSVESSINGQGDSKRSLLQQLRLAVPGASSSKDAESQSKAVLNEADMFHAIRRHFNFNANINSKVKVLQVKDLRRLLNKLRYAKTICEQKIIDYRRNSALLVNDNPGTSFSPAGTSFEDSKFSFDISFNSELVRSFRRPSITESGLESTTGTGLPHFKPKKKNIFKFNVIMTNDFSRQYFKTFLQESLFNLQSGEFQRSSRNKFRKDILICQCCGYLVEVWEMIQQVLEHFYHFYNAHSSAQSVRVNRQFADLHSLFSHCYHMVLQTVADSRFFYTFSDRFLQLPNEVMKLLEAFLLGDVELAMLKRSFDDFSTERIATRLDFSTEDGQQTQMGNSCLSRIDLPAYLNVFVLLEKIIFKCLCDEFYPQFLISSEYDQMLLDPLSSNINLDRETSSTRWCTLKFTNYGAPDQVLSKQFSSLLNAHPKAIHKILFNGDQVDIVKNRSILLNCLEFPFLCLQSLQFIVQHRLSLKIYLKHFISQLCSVEGSNDIAPLYMDVAQVLNLDIVYYNDMFSHLHSMLCSSFCFLHSDFSCQISDVQVQPLVRSANSLEGKFISFVEGIFSPEGSHASANGQGTSTKTSLTSSNPLLEGNYRLAFRLCTTAFPSGLNHLPAFIRSQLQSSFSPFWSVVYSFDGFIEMFHQLMSPSLRMMVYLNRVGLYDFVHILGSMMEPKYALLNSQFPSNECDPDQHRQQYWEKLTKHLAQDQIAIKRFFRHEVREQIKREKAKTKPQYSERLSFKNLLDKELDSSMGGDNSSSEQARSSRSNSLNTNSNNQPLDQSADLMQITHCLTQLFSRLTVDHDLIKTTGFLNLVQYECGVPVSQSVPTVDNQSSDSTSLCLRCQLIENLVENNMDDLNSFMQQSLCLIASKSGIDPRTLVSQVVHNAQPTHESSTTERKGKHNLLDAFTIPQQATKLFLQSTTTLPKVHGANQSGQLLFLHARSLLTDRTSLETLDYTLASFRHFDRFCQTCTEKLYSFKTSGEPKLGSHGQRKRPSKIKFRLFNIDATQQTSGGQQPQRLTSSGGGSEVALDVVANLKKSGSITDVSSMTSSSMLHENVGSAFFDDDSFGSMEPFSLGLGDFDSNLIEPLFQLLVEVFELKGTMIRTFRRTLMFGFRLVFGQTMFSKQIKLSLKHLVDDGNILHLIATLQSTIQKWNDNVQRPTAQPNGSPDNGKTSNGANLGNTTERTASPATLSREQSRTSKEIPHSPSLSSTVNYLSDLTELLDSFPALLNSSHVGSVHSESSAPQSRPGSATSRPIFVAVTPPDDSTVQVAADLVASESTQPSGDVSEQASTEDEQAANIARLQILAKQLLFASVPRFLNHLFGTENTITGLNKFFDILQYQTLNKQLIYEFLEAFLLEYYPEFKKI